MNNVRSIFITAVIIVTAYLIGFIFSKPVYILDCIFAYIVIGVFFLLVKKYPIKPWLVALGMAPFIIELTALTFGFFSFSIYGLGFDKMVHFLNSFMITFLFYLWISAYNRRYSNVLIVMVAFMVIGVGSLAEINEFVGQRYLHVYGDGMFSQTDSLPSTLKNDLVIYDTWWDMIMNVLGTACASLMLVIRNVLHRYNRHIF